MKSLIIDSASSCMTIAAKNDNQKAILILDIGMKQSQKLLPSIDIVLSQLELEPRDLDYMALTSGPGTFTGLRLAFSALKAIELAYNIPIYAIPTLEAYAFPFKDFDETIISVIDAKKDQFFAAIYKKGKAILEAEDTTIERIADMLTNSEKLIVTGADAEIFKEEILKTKPELKITATYSIQNISDSIFKIAEEMIEQKKEPLKDYDGPIYLRKSEAEIALENKK